MGDFSIFGSYRKYDPFRHSSAIRKVVITRGLVGDYLKQIKISQYLGLTPYLAENGEVGNLEVRKKRVYIGQKDVTQVGLTPSNILIVFDTKKSKNTNFSFFALKGRSGRDGFDYLSWFPNQTLEMYRREEACSFFFNDPTSGLVFEDGKVVGLRNHSNPKNNAALSRQYAGVAELPTKKFSLVLNDSLYRISNVELGTTEGLSSILICTFKLDGMPKGKQLLTSTKDMERGIMIKGGNLEILGASPHIDNIPYVKNQFNTIFVLWNTVSPAQSFYQLNETKNYFTTKKCVTEPPPNVVYIGAKADVKKRYIFVGQIAMLEIYEIENIPGQFPAKLRENLVLDHVRRVVNF